MINLKINNLPILAKAGTILVDAATEAGIEIPTMCRLKGAPGFSSCMVCSVKDKQTNRIIPSCSASVEEGMDIETDSEEIHALRKAALELLLSNHTGNCEGPCTRICPAHMNIPEMIRRIAAGNHKGAVETVKKDIVLPSTLGRICPAPCEKGCRRKGVDEPLGICLLKRFVGDRELELGSPYQPEILSKKCGTVAIIGGGPTGLGAAAQLAILGAQVTVYDQHANPGGKLQSDVHSDILPREILDGEIEWIRSLGITFRMNTRITAADCSRLCEESDAVVLATGKATRGLNLAIGPGGYHVNRKTLQTSIENVFAGGNAIRNGRMAIRSLADGKTIAYSVYQYLSGQPVIGEPKRFDSRISVMSKEEHLELARFSSEQCRVTTEDGYSEEQAVCETTRCLHCDCRKPDTCKLRNYANKYGADASNFASPERDSIKILASENGVFHEPGKCIKCGCCVRFAEMNNIPGLAFSGRGFDMQIKPPFDEDFASVMRQSSEAIVEQCPTGALSKK